jgi:hypothetical protein
MVLAWWLFVHPSLAAELHQWLRDHLWAANGLRDTFEMTHTRLKELVRDFGRGRKDKPGQKMVFILGQKAGDIVCVPPGWIHFVRNARPLACLRTISLSAEFPAVHPALEGRNVPLLQRGARLNGRTRRARQLDAAPPEAVRDGVPGSRCCSGGTAVLVVGVWLGRAQSGCLDGWLRGRVPCASMDGRLVDACMGVWMRKWGGCCLGGPVMSEQSACQGGLRGRVFFVFPAAGSAGPLPTAWATSSCIFQHVLLVPCTTAGAHSRLSL